MRTIIGGSDRFSFVEREVWKNGYRKVFATLVEDHTSQYVFTYPSSASLLSPSSIFFHGRSFRAAGGYACSVGGKFNSSRATNSCRWSWSSYGTILGCAFANAQTAEFQWTDTEDLVL